MQQEQKIALQITKEIIVKFIEVGRISPTNFHEFFPRIFEEIAKTMPVLGANLNKNEGCDGRD